MCNINIIRSKKGELSGKALSCINTMGFMSSTHNRDGSGMLAREPNGTIAISHNPKGKVRVVGRYNLVATHQRLSTSGHNGKNTHPFTRKHFALMHNGVFWGIGTQDKSDTAKYCDLLEDAMQGGKNLIEAIKEVHKETSGSFSILLYDRDNKRFLYYKNSQTSFYGLSHPMYDIYSTDEDNLEFAKWFLRLKDAKKIKFEPDTIYNLETREKLGTITEKEPDPVVDVKADFQSSIDWFGDGMDRHKYPRNDWMNGDGLGY